jgi:hypothetical protein
VWTWPHDRGHMWEEISPHLSRYEVVNLQIK